MSVPWTEASCSVMSQAGVKDPEVLKPVEQVENPVDPLVPLLRLVLGRFQAAFLCRLIVVQNHRCHALICPALLSRCHGRQCRRKVCRRKVLLLNVASQEVPYSISLLMGQGSEIPRSRAGEALSCPRSCS